LVQETFSLRRKLSPESWHSVALILLVSITADIHFDSVINGAVLRVLALAAPIAGGSPRR
jgi:hypothetical protein